MVGCVVGEHAGRTGRAHWEVRWGLVMKDPKGLPEMELYQAEMGSL